MMEKIKGFMNVQKEERVKNLLEER